MQKTILKHMVLPTAARELIESLFPRQISLRQSDLHKSNLAAERGVARTWAWPSALFRCSLHRIRTAEIRALNLDPPHRDFLA